MLKKIDLNESDRTPGMYGVLFVYYIWMAGLSVTGVVAAGFGIYYVLFLILGAVLLVVCPCIGLGVIGATLGVWGMLLIAAVGIAVYTASFATIVSLLLPLTLFFNKNEKTIRAVTIVFIIHCFVGYYLYKSGGVDLVFSGQSPTVEKIERIISGSKLQNERNESVASSEAKVEFSDINPFYVDIVGAFPSEVFKNSKYTAFLNMFFSKTNEQKFTGFFDDGTAFVKESDFLYASGCAFNKCSEREGFMFINTVTNDTVVVTFDKSQSVTDIQCYTKEGVFFTKVPDGYIVDRRVPKAFVSWFEQNGFVIINPNQDNTFKYKINQVINGNVTKPSVSPVKKQQQNINGDNPLMNELFRKRHVDYE